MPPSEKAPVIESAPTPEEELRTLVASLLEYDSGADRDPEARRKLSHKIEDLVPLLAEQSEKFKNILKQTFAEFVDGDLSMEPQQRARWMESIFIAAFKRYEEQS